MHSTPGDDWLANEMRRMFTWELREWLDATRDRDIAIRLRWEIRRRADEGGYGLTARARGEVTE
jgi:hypothetical protein